MGVFVTPLVSYIGSRYNKCRIIGICGLFYSLGCVIYTFPYFIGNKYFIVSIPSDDSVYLNSNKTDINVDVCKSPIVLNSSNLSSSLNIFDHVHEQNLTTSEIIDDATNPLCKRNLAYSWEYYMFVLGQLLMSIGTAPLFSLGIVFLCDNLDESKHALYTGKKSN
jgi:hypothetical protein